MAKQARAVKKSELTRQRFLDAAARVFADRGYGHTRLTDIADAANSRVGGLYFYFSSKNELVAELLRISTQRSIDALNEAIKKLDDEATTEEYVREMTAAMLGEIMSSSQYAAAFNRVYPQVPGNITEAHRPHMREFFDLWRWVVQRGRRRGEIRKDVDSAILRLTILGSIQWSNQWLQSRSASINRVASQMAKIFMSGIQADA